MTLTQRYYSTDDTADVLALTSANSILMEADFEEGIAESVVAERNREALTDVLTAQIRVNELTARIKALGDGTDHADVRFYITGALTFYSDIRTRHIVTVWEDRQTARGRKQAEADAQEVVRLERILETAKQALADAKAEAEALTKDAELIRALFA